MRDRYEILGVADDASPREIRAAYVLRMKACHPDRATGISSLNAASVGEAYAVLRDPVARAAYDLERSRRAAAPRRHRRRRLRRRLVSPDLARRAIGIVLLLGCLTIATAAWLIARRPPVAAPVREESRVQSPLAAETLGAVRLALVNEDYTTTTSGPDAAIAYSTDCFASAARDPSAAMLDYCIAYDAAAAARSVTPRPFFSQAERRRRAEAVAPTASLAERTRWTAIEIAVRRLGVGASDAHADVEPVFSVTSSQR